MPLQSAVFYGRKVDGELKLPDRAEIARILHDIPDGHIEFIVREMPKTISARRRRYYFVAVVKPIHQGLVALGHDMTQQQVHKELEKRFLYREEPDALLGGFIKVQLSLKDDAEHPVDNKTMSDFMDRCYQFAAELGIVIEDREPISDEA